MPNTVTLTQTEFDTMSKRITQLETMVKNLSAKIDTLMDREPPEGTQEWWDWSQKKSLQEIEKGDYYQMNSAEELDEFLTNIDDHRTIDKFHAKSEKTVHKNTSTHSKEGEETAAYAY